MGTPYHIPRYAPKLFSCDKASAEFQALSLIAGSLAHPQRTLLTTFIQQAVDREVASRFFLDEVLERKNATVSEFLADWISLLRKVTPVICKDIDLSLKQSIWQRDDGQCCIAQAHERKKYDEDPLVVHILPPTLFRDQDMTQGYFVKTNYFIPSIQMDVYPFIKLENKAMDSSSLPNAKLIDVHHRFAPALAWLEVYDYMRQACDSLSNSKSHSSVGVATKLPATKSWNRWCLQPVPRIFQYLWMRTPEFLRGFAYRHLASLSRSLYGHTGSDRMYRLPFNLYLRVAPRDWAPKHQAELESLRIVEKYTQIPAPRGIDAIQYSDSSYLLMTGLPGRGIGQMLSTMTDKQLDTVAQDLKQFIAELRQIPHKTDSEFQICNSLGGGILDWRIGDSQHKDLRFRDETEFNQMLTFDLPLDEDAWKQISRSHGVKHDIVFTHADLNLRNILVDENGRISGIVDWECAGWYPEYWEYSKMHFTVRHTYRWIADVVDQIFQTYCNELQVEDMLSSMVPSW
ncbi:kinase-like protein [Cucurbitaria berberidis CBS 394.84]|uniref:Kinase-like protein n=1 Tax=Cucurbitaria berberidis CBS 394.84 TaxID=1168544 RepID=A0A9P4L4E0_9PLEO|nr:kinase-like protein [Cucurbitaria berberidis CBS 394.84]KAF1841896.1 kinase-like protein [Cucurbitaria berberidis CBS 394.84]